MRSTPRGARDPRVLLQLPSIIALTTSGREERGQIWVRPAGKPPKLRFPPGSFIRYKNKLYEIMFAYRVAAKPLEWLYCCEERQELKSGELDGPMATILSDAGSTTPR